jgi:hypothetical protein
MDPALSTTEQEGTLDDIIKEVERSVHRSEAQSFLLTEVTQISYLGDWSCQLIPVLSHLCHLSLSTNRILVWRWKVVPG